MGKLQTLRGCKASDFMRKYTLNFFSKEKTMMIDLKGFVKKALQASVMMLSVACLAGADDTLITFSTNGSEPDRYADGEVVMDGECYALVWSKDGVFEGFQADGAPIDPNDQVVLVAAVALNGHCPEVVFQVAAEKAAALAGGRYGVLLLDTRVNRGGKVAPRGTMDGKLAMVNGFGAVTEGLKVASSEHATINEILKPEGQVAGENAAVAANVKQPRIKHIWIEGGNVFLRVENLSGFMRVQGGGQPDAVLTMGGATETDGGEEDVILVAPKVGNSGFYKVVRN